MSTSKCRITFKLEENQEDYKFKLEGDCEDVLRSMEILPARRQRYLARRLEIEE